MPTAASTLRLLRLRRHTTVTTPMITSKTIGTTAAAAYKGALLACFSDPQPGGLPACGLIGDEDTVSVSVSVARGESVTEDDKVS